LLRERCAKAQRSAEHRIEQKAKIRAKRSIIRVRQISKKFTVLPYGNTKKPKGFCTLLETRSSKLTGKPTDLDFAYYNQPFICKLACKEDLFSSN
jgi:hypothetical protein